MSSRVADFISKDEMERAIRKLDGTEFEGRKVYIEEVSPERICPCMLLLTIAYIL